MEKHKQNLRAKIRKELILIGSVAILLSTISVTIGYTLLRRSALRAANDHKIAISELAAENIMSTMNRVFSLLKPHTKCRTCESILTTINSSYPADEKDRETYVNQLSKSFVKSPRDNPMLREHLANEAIISMFDQAEYSSGIKDMLVTDKFGQVVASTNHVRELSQTNKDWWQAAFNGGAGNFAVGEAIFDENSSSWCLPFAGPVKNKGEEVVGVYRVLIDIELFFGPIRDIRIGETGNLAIVDKRNYLLFYPGVKPFAQKLCDYEGLQKLLTSKTGCAIINRVFGHKGPVLAGFSTIKNPLLMERGMEWDAIAMNETKEIYGGLSGFVIETLPLSIVLVILVVFATAQIFKMLYVRPTAELEKWMKRISLGDLDYKMEVREDEFIKELADSLHAMVDSLKINTASAALLNYETDRRLEAEEEFKKRSENIEQIVKNQIEQPVLSMQHGMAMLKEGGAAQQSDKHKHLLDSMIKIVSDLKNASEKLAYIAAIDSGDLKLNMQELDARALLKNVILAFESRIAARGLQLKLDIPKRPLTILADVARIDDVFNILLNNALAATESGSIEISIGYLPKEVGFAVSDTGKGMSDKDAGSLFTRSRNSGISLSIAKGIIAAHKGLIYAESEPGKGTTVFFRLPIDISSKQ